MCESPENIEFDHIDPSLKRQRLGKYDWWSWNGGVEAMKEELKNCRPLCRSCHDNSEFSCKKVYKNIDEMPNKTKTQRQLKKSRQYRDLKNAYILTFIFVLMCIYIYI